MAAPKYLNELKYTFVQPPRVATDAYTIDDPETAFERSVQQQFATGNAHLRNEEFGLALAAFQRLQAEILRVADPTLPVVITPHPGFELPFVAAMVTPMLNLTVGILQSTKEPKTLLPGFQIPPGGVFDPKVRKQLADLGASGIQSPTPVAARTAIHQALSAAKVDDWKSVEAQLEVALEVLGNRQLETRAVLTHDLAVAKEKNTDRDGAIELAVKAAGMFKRSGNPTGELQAVLTGASLNAKAGKEEEATRLRGLAKDLRLRPGTAPVRVSGGPELVTFGAAVSNLPHRSTMAGNGSLVPFAPEVGRADIGPLVEPLTAAVEPSEELVLLATSLPTSAVRAASVGMLRANGQVQQLALTEAGMIDFYESISKTSVLADLMDFVWHPTTLVAYLTHIYFFVLPMAIGDCLAGLGAHEDALASYQRVLTYPYINRNVEAVRLWTRMAEAHLEWGDSVYRRAGDERARQLEASLIYSKIVRPDGSIDPASPLYAPAIFGPVKERVEAVVAALDDPTELAENAQIVTPLVGANARLQQLDAGLNYLGMGADFRPPFTFEYLQSLARTLAQQGERAEQSYIQFKSQAENEQLRADQLDQQVEVATASVELERRGVAEAQAGFDVATASRDYARLKNEHAREARDDFDEVRWDLLNLAQLEAWAGASNVDRDDQVKLTITGYSSYEADSKRRNVVMKELARARTRITHDLEAARLQREVESSEAYEQVAESQRDQAIARRRVAEMRQQVAEIQVRHARENAEFVDLKEFSARTWYEMARTSRRLVRRYLDMAIEVAYLMERAYELETGRDLARIRFDYAGPGTDGLLAASRLLADIESFSHDYATSTTTKKAPAKTTFSLAEQLPMAFAQLRATGAAGFDTTLADFERAHPGAYLGRIVAVEVQFVGLTNALGVHGDLRNVGVSRFRDKTGSEVALVYPSDVLPLSQYEVRQDALVFRFDQKELRLFENCGLATGWLLSLPFDANDVDLTNLLDVRLVVYWDAFHDAALETAVRDALPSTGSATKAWSLLLNAPDELFFLQHQGEGEIEMAATDLPFSQTDTSRTRVRVRLTGPPAAVGGANVVIRTASGPEVAVSTDSEGLLDSDTDAALAPLLGQPVPDTWTLVVADVADRLDDVQVFVEYDFSYRTRA